MAYVANRNPRSGSNFLTACIMPIFPSDIRSDKGNPYPRYPMAIFATNRKWLVTSLCAASTSSRSDHDFASMYSSSFSSIGNERMRDRYLDKFPSGVNAGISAFFVMCLPLFLWQISLPYYI